MRGRGKGGGEAERGRGEGGGERGYVKIGEERKDERD